MVARALESLVHPCPRPKLTAPALWQPVQVPMLSPLSAEPAATVLPHPRPESQHCPIDSSLADLTPLVGVLTSLGTRLNLLSVTGAEGNHILDTLSH